MCEQVAPLPLVQFQNCTIHNNTGRRTSNLWNHSCSQKMSCFFFFFFLKEYVLFVCVWGTCSIALKTVVTLRSNTEALKLKFRHLISHLSPCIFPFSSSIQVKAVVVKSFCYQHYAVCVLWETTHSLMPRTSEPGNSLVAL